MHQWKIKGGTIYVVSGLLTNNAALYAHNYNFYFQKEGEKTWHQIPLIDKAKPGDYELNITTKAKEERMVRDARIEKKANDVFLFYARSTRENDFNGAPINVTRYKLISTEGDDWPYLFERISVNTYPPQGENGVDAVLKQEVKKIK
ncbi:hypothetical protein AYR66_02545 [Noviherbaspirillum denitrificans]|uniref:Uncharacterized protein n=1 Tax=Noviherbaspirillum denitrificans TaxID=1968433 RepID=A0A254T6R1_9BURK|nr:hypothetical protein AYR66_02545 [Noviherbaspirillum denitrificans]